MKRIILFSIITLALSSCAPKFHSYKVTFQNGNVEYFELDRKPDADAKSIEYNGETYIGVKSIERID